MLKLAKNGKTRYVIALAADATKTERNAANELAAHLKKICGAKFPVVPPRKTSTRPCIAVGPAACEPVLKGTLRGLGDEGSLLQTVGENIALTGEIDAPRGTLYAVYLFLEEELGCRWYTREVSHIPRVKELSIGPFNRRVTPAFEYRETLQFEASDTKWSARNRTNGLWATNNKRDRIREDWGGYRKWANWVHTFHSYIPPNEHFEAHPEWYSQIDGVRTPNAQLCLTNKELLAELTVQVRNKLLAVPDASVISVSQNDNYAACQCDKCRVSDRRHNQSGTLLDFVNAVAGSIRADFTDVCVETLAYQYTRTPARGVRPADNVIVRLCSFECDFLHPFTHQNNIDFRDDLEGWTQICDRVYIWDYVTNYAHFVLPHPNWFVLGDNVRYLAEQGVKGLFEQSNHQSAGGEMGEMRAWLLAKLLWNPDSDERALISEFLGAVYGRASSHLGNYMNCVHDAAMAIESFPGSVALQNSNARTGVVRSPRIGCVLDLNSPVDSPLLSADVLLASMRHLRAAQQAVTGNSKRSRRVRLVTLPVIYAILLRWKEIRSHAKRTDQAWLLPESRMKAFAGFAEVYRDFGITHLGESWSHRDLTWLRKVCSGKLKHREIP